MKKPGEMTVQEFVSTYQIFRNGSKIFTFYLPLDPQTHDEVIAVMKSRKPEIMQYLLEREEAQKIESRERQEKIGSIPGLAELRAALEDEENWRKEYNRSIVRGDSGAGLRPRPQYDWEAMEAKYPRATAYICAENMSHTPNLTKAASGRRALERIINGEDYTQALADARSEWNAYLMAHYLD